MSENKTEISENKICDCNLWGIISNGESRNAEKIQDNPKHLQQKVYVCGGRGKWKKNEFLSRLQKVVLFQRNSLKAFYENLD